MPQKIEFTKNDFLFLKRELEGIGYRMKSKIEFQGDFERLGLSAPRPRDGREAGFVYTANHLTSIIWTSYDLVNENFRGEDLGWPLIVEGDYARYFSKPLRRTENFLTQLLRRAWVNRWRIENRPRCPHCMGHMMIMERYRNDGKGKMSPTGQHYWGCFVTDKHPDKKPAFTGWDKIGPNQGLPPKAKKFVEKMRQRVRVYKTRNKQLGVMRTPMRKIRRKWQMKRPENMIS